MSDESKVPSGEPEVKSSGPNTEVKTDSQQPSGPSGSKSDTVKYETYQKSLQQEKALRQRLQDAEAKLNEAEQQRMEAQGKKDELIEFLKKENSEIKAQQTKAEAERVHEKVSSQIATSALQLGCVDVDLAKQLVDVSTLDIGPDAQVNVDSMSLALDRLKRDKPYLFAGKKASVVDAPPVSTVNSLQDGPTSFEGLDDKQQRSLLEQQLAKLL